MLEPGMHPGEFVDGLVAASRLEPDAYERMLRRTACELANGGTVEFADGFFAAGSGAACCCCIPACSVQVCSER